MLADLGVYEDLIGHLSVAATFRKLDVDPPLNGDGETMQEAALALRALVDEVRVLRLAVETMSSKVTLAQFALNSTKPIKDIVKLVQGISSC